mmetsp:Transcript_57717/g.122784  ORF Transcript_57717/g.122784 Transcript_57717/m.122784 type:complete len:203 (+) Transcript_57717:189-797(+)
MKSAPNRMPFGASPGGSFARQQRCSVSPVVSQRTRLISPMVKSPSKSASKTRPVDSSSLSSSTLTSYMYCACLASMSAAPGTPNSRVGLSTKTQPKRPEPLLAPVAAEASSSAQMPPRSPRQRLPVVRTRSPTWRGSFTILLHAGSSDFFTKRCPRAQAYIVGPVSGKIPDACSTDGVASLVGTAASAIVAVVHCIVFTARF